MKHENSFYPFYQYGSLQFGRNFNAGDYRFGFNGKENDNEVSGTGNTKTAMFWEYDTRLGRRWNVDPVVKPWESTYACFYINPIQFTDPLGLDGGDPSKKGDKFIGDDGKEYTNSCDAVEIKSTRIYSKSWTFDFGRKYDQNPWSSHVLRTSWENNKSNPHLNDTPLRMWTYPGPSKWMRGFNSAFGTSLNIGIIAPLASEFLIPMVFESGFQISLKYAGYKFIGSSLVQLTLNQRVDIFDASLDAVTLPGLGSATLGGFVDASIGSEGYSFSTIGFNKSLGESIFDSGSRLVFGSFRSNINNVTKPMLKNTTDRIFWNSGRFYILPLITGTVSKNTKKEIFGNGKF